MLSTTPSSGFGGTIKDFRIVPLVASNKLPSELLNRSIACPMKDPSKARGLVTALARPRIRAWRSRWSERKQEDSVRSTFARKICCTRGMCRAFSSAECRADWGNLSAAFTLDVWQASKRSTSRGRSGATSLVM